MKRLAIIGAGRTACDYAQEAKEMGIETHCFAWEKGALAKDYADFFHSISIFDEDCIAAECEKLGINGVVSTTELTIAVAARLADRLGLPGNSVDIAQTVTNKYSNRVNVLDCEGLLQPRFALVTSTEDIDREGLTYPIILKPTSLGGKRGVSVAMSRDDADCALRYAESEAGGIDAVLAEEYIEGGMECSVESLSCEGRHFFVQITEKDSSGPPHCVELGHHQPASLTDEMREKIEFVLGGALTRLGITSGPCHTEIKVIDGSVYLIEFNVRPGGDLIAHPLTKLSTGYSYLGGAIEIALGEFKEPSKASFHRRKAGVQFVTEQTPNLDILFKKCEAFSWLHMKHEVLGGSREIRHNDCDATNYFVYCTEDERPDFTAEADKASHLVGESNSVDSTSCIYDGAKLVDSVIGPEVVVGSGSDVIRTNLDFASRVDRRSLIIDSSYGVGSYSGCNVVVKNAEIGKYSCIAWNVSIGGDSHNYCAACLYDDLAWSKTFGMSFDKESEYVGSKRTYVGNDVWIGAGAQVLSGLKIGDGAVIGAGAIVTKDVPPYAVVVGAPARIVKYRFDPETVDRLLTLRWWDWGPCEILHMADALHSDLTDDSLLALEAHSVERSKVGAPQGEDAR